MSKSVLDITSEHGRKMYSLGLKHAINVLEAFDREAAHKYLTEQLAREEKELETMNWHSRFDEQHRKDCQSCYDGYIDFLQDEASAGVDDINEDEE